MMVLEICRSASEPTASTAAVSVSGKTSGAGSGVTGVTVAEFDRVPVFDDFTGVVTVMTGALAPLSRSCG